MDNKQVLLDEIDMLKKIVDIMPGHVYWKDKYGIYLGCNDNQAHTLELVDKAGMIGKTDFELPWSADAEELRKIDLQVMQSGKEHCLEEPVTLPNGDKAFFLSKKVPLRNRSGEIIGVLGISFDVTAEKEARQLRAEKEKTEQYSQAMGLLASAMAHELRTPLTGISAGINGLDKHLNTLLTGYQAAKQQSLTTDSLQQRTIDILQAMPASIARQARYAHVFIDMMLMSLKAGKIISANFQSLSIAHCIEKALDHYPFHPQEQQLIRWENDADDFTYTGDESLTMHVLFNLLKNALYYVKAAGKGEITISLDSTKRQLIFTDSGQGIPAEVLPKIFQRYYSNHESTGVGLAFCQLVMESYQGNIDCTSRLGEYTTFTLSFP